MRVYNRPFCDNGRDYEKMWAFLIDDYTDKEDKFIWTIGRLGDWKYGCWNKEKAFPSFLRNNAQLWFSNFDELVGFVISEGGDSNFTVFAKRGFEFLYTEMITWLKTNWSSRGTLNSEVHEYQDVYIKQLEKEGFIRKDNIAETWQYDLSKKVNESISLDRDFTIKDFIDIPDFKGIAALYRNAFNGCDDVRQFDILRYEYNRESPCFNPSLDLAVVDKNGVFVSACVGFVDYKNNYAEIEKVCTHSNYRRKGFAEAVIRECFKRLYAIGIKYAYITGYGPEAMNLYAKLGATKSRKWFSYELVEK